jgi:hypothetical protein
MLVNKFTRALLDHVANDAKVPAEVVGATFSEWRTHVEDVASKEAVAHEKYMTRIELPRAERHQQYEEYCTEKARLWDTWMQSPQGRKAQALHNWIRLQVPEVLKDGVEQERIYTKNIRLH